MGSGGCDQLTRGRMSWGVGASLPERRVLEDGLGEGLPQRPGAGLAVLADPGQVSAEVDQKVVVGLGDAGGLQDPLQSLPTLLHTLALYETRTAHRRIIHFNFLFKQEQSWGALPVTPR